MWNERADLAQQSIARFFGGPVPGFSHPAEEEDVFHYWWLAHLVDVRIDAYERTGEAGWLEQARLVVEHIRSRNGDSLFNDYFDDMLWLGLALSRMPGHTADAETLWAHVWEQGWNEHEGGGIAWRKEQLDYKNTPANAPFVILSARLGHLPEAQRAMEWLDKTLVRGDGFVEDGINRLGDHAVDTGWRFSYNQGAYIGACVSLARLTGDEDYVRRAVRTARLAISTLAPSGVFAEENDWGDEGLFKGIYYRYAGELLAYRDDPGIRAFVLSSTEQLWRHGTPLAGTDWRHAPPARVALSTQLSAVMATEVCSRLSPR